MHAILDEIVDEYFVALDASEEQIEAIEEAVFSDEMRERDIQQRLFTARRQLVSFRRKVMPLREVLARLLRGEVAAIDASTLVLMQDVYDHLLRVVDTIDSHRELMGNAVDAHLAIISNQMNEVMKRMTSWGALLLGATLIAGDLRHELRAHARTRLGIRVSLCIGPDGDHDRPWLVVLPAPRLAVSRAIQSSNAEYQVLEALRTNRQKRNRENAFIVEGVRNINAALANNWTVRDVLVPVGATRSAWADSVMDRVGRTVELSAELFNALTDRAEPPELLLVVDKRRRSLADVPTGVDTVVTVLDRPASPGNIGSIIRTCDALGSSAVVVVGHAADPYDPQSVRASTGSFFAVPTVEVGSVADLTQWAKDKSIALVATDESGDQPLDSIPSPPVALMFGNETAGLSRALRDAAHVTVAIPMTGSASSLNVAAAHAVVLFSSTRRG